MIKLYLYFCIFFIISCHPQSGTEIVGALGTNACIATAHPIASEVGIKVLKDGGNAFDAAVAVHFTLAVVYPRAGNIGGGGFAVFRQATGEAGSLDFREMAPAQAHPDMFLDERGDPVAELSRKGALAVGVPGSVEGMFQLHKKYGSKNWEDLLVPAIHYAKEGVRLTKNEADILNSNRENILSENSFTTPFVKEDLWKEGDLLIQNDLANTLELIQKSGSEGFYKGEISEKIVRTLNRKGGIISKEDLKNYVSKWRKPVKGTYKNYRILSMAPPSSGGVALLQLMKGIENYPIKKWGHNSTRTIHVMTELERRVYADGATYLGDPDYSPVPVDELLNEKYLAKRFSDIDMNKATPSEEIKEGYVERIESIETTHYSIVDIHKNAVSVTTTLNGNFGSKVVVEGAGFFLNNEMDDFTAKPGDANMFGLVGGLPNVIEPGKRMLSSMTPTIVEKDDNLYLVLGTPGGSTIITSVFQTILNVIEHDMGMQEAINAKRLHHQWLPDQILMERDAIDSSTKDELSALGHRFDTVNKIGKIEGILIRPHGSLEAGADYTRGDDTALAF